MVVAVFLSSLSALFAFKDDVDSLHDFDKVVVLNGAVEFLLKHLMANLVKCRARVVLKKLKDSCTLICVDTIELISFDLP